MQPIPPSSTAAGSNYGGASATSIQTTTSLTVAAGDTIFAGVRFLKSGSPTVSIDGGVGNTFVSRGSILAGDGTWEEIFTCDNAVAGTYAITAHFSVAQQYHGVIAGNYSKTALSPFDVLGAAAYAALASVTSGAMTTTQADAVLVALAQVSGTGLTWTPGSGWTLRGQDASNVLMLEDKVVSTLQSGVTASASANGGGIPKTIIALALKGLLLSSYERSFRGMGRGVGRGAR